MIFDEANTSWKERVKQAYQEKRKGKTSSRNIYHVVVYEAGRVLNNLGDKRILRDNFIHQCMFQLSILFRSGIITTQVNDAVYGFVLAEDSFKRRKETFELGASAQDFRRRSNDDPQATTSYFLFLVYFSHRASVPMSPACFDTKHIGRLLNYLKGLYLFWDKGVLQDEDRFKKLESDIWCGGLPLRDVLEDFKTSTEDWPCHLPPFPAGNMTLTELSEYLLALDEYDNNVTEKIIIERKKLCFSSVMEEDHRGKKIGDLRATMDLLEQFEGSVDDDAIIAQKMTLFRAAPSVDNVDYISFVEYLDHLRLLKAVEGVSDITDEECKTVREGLQQGLLACPERAPFIPMGAYELGVKSRQGSSLL
jgi:hypothetical protein